MKILPGIMPKDLTELRNKLSLIFDWGGAVQLDLMDGVYVPEATWPYNGENQEEVNKILNEDDGLPYWENFSFEFDLMVKNASLDLDMYLKLGATRIVFHPDAEDDKEGFLERLESLDLYTRDTVKFGVALRADESIENIRRYIPFVDFVQCMGIEKIGFQGEPFDERVIQNIKKVHEEFPDMEISVDGGVNLQNAKSLIDAGADRLVVGSAVWKTADPEETIREFEKL
jgi:ribulose-phosphate 3-epimerase